MCPVVQELWIAVEKFMNEFDEHPLDFNRKNVFLNELVPTRSNVKNIICLILKQYIYRKRCFKEAPNINEFKKLIWNIRNVERYIAVKNSQEDKHMKKWSNNPTYYESLVLN